MEIWQAVVLGLVEGITEYLPISSTGHLILTAHLLGLDKPESKDAVDAFNIVVQGGAIAAVLGLYWARCVQMLRGLLGKDPVGLRLLINLLVAFLPAAVLGLLLNEWIERHLFSPGPVLGAILLGGVFMIALDQWRGRRLARLSESERAALEAEVDALTPLKALFIGLLQCVAMWPGTSRSMMTLVGGMLVGLKPRAAAEFAFLLGLPTLGGATVYKLYKNLSHADENGGNLFEKLGAWPVAVGLIVAAISAAIAVKWLVAFLNRHGLSAFGWYRIGLFAVMMALVAAGGMKIAP